MQLQQPQTSLDLLLLTTCWMLTWEEQEWGHQQCQLVQVLQDSAFFLQEMQALRRARSRGAYALIVQCIGNADIKQTVEANHFQDGRAAMLYLDGMYDPHNSRSAHILDAPSHWSTCCPEAHPWHDVRHCTGCSHATRARHRHTTHNAQ